MCSLHRLKIMLKGEVVFSVLLVSLFIGGQATSLFVADGVPVCLRPLGASGRRTARNFVSC